VVVVNGENLMPPPLKCLADASLPGEQFQYLDISTTFAE
jgi:hypothetical protein